MKSVFNIKRGLNWKPDLLLQKSMENINLSNNSLVTNIY